MKKDTTLIVLQFFKLDISRSNILFMLLTAEQILSWSSLRSFRALALTAIPTKDMTPTIDPSRPKVT